MMLPFLSKNDIKSLRLFGLINCLHINTIPAIAIAAITITILPFSALYLKKNGNIIDTMANIPTTVPNVDSMLLSITNLGFTLEKMNVIPIVSIVDTSINNIVTIYFALIKFFLPFGIVAKYACQLLKSSYEKLDIHIMTIINGKKPIIFRSNANM